MCGRMIRLKLQLVRRKVVLAASKEEAKECCMEAYRKEERLKGVYIIAKIN